MRGILTSYLTKTHPTSEEEDTIKIAFLRDELGASAAGGAESQGDDKESFDSSQKSSKDSNNVAGDNSADDANWKLLCALTYRITRKKILKNAILLLEEVIDWVDKILTNKNQVGSMMTKSCID